MRIRNLKVPDWLKPGLHVHDKDALILTEALRSWVTLCKFRAKLTERVCEQLICMELAGAKRQQILYRLRKYRENIRIKKEMDALHAIHPGCSFNPQARTPVDTGAVR